MLWVFKEEREEEILRTLIFCMCVGEALKLLILVVVLLLIKKQTSLVDPQNYSHSH